MYLYVNKYTMELHALGAHTIKDTADIIENQVCERCGYHSSVKIEALAFANSDRYSGHQD
jgi:hypothetical protein